MNEYYRWSEDLTDFGTPIVQLSRMELTGLDEWDLIDGKKIEKWHKSNVGYFDDNGIAYDLLNTTMQVHVISERIKDAMESLGLNGVQFLPLPIFSEDGTTELGDYYVLHVHKKVDAVDLKKSDCLLWGDESPDHRPDELRDLKRAVLARQKIKTHQIFRLTGWEVYLVIDDAVKRVIEDTGATGCVFSKLGTAD